MTISDLRDVLLGAREVSGAEFAGLGVVVYTALSRLPVLPLRSSAPTFSTPVLTMRLAAISSMRSDYHDGFHLISLDGELTHIAHYFSPPILSDVEINRSRLFGGRYLAALFGSAIEGVHLTGIASNGFGLAVFRMAREVHFEKLP